ncbi:MAG: superoxide dismutase family protein [Chitinivibrionales bacterium]|nr:superoxide dismutase family protein [Chitinivibrionales bacterium]
MSPEVMSAVAVLHPTEGNDVRSTVQFEKINNAIRVQGEVTGLEPGKHGFHVHEYGDCSADDATSAGGHYAPRGMPHGAPTDSLRHVGDLGNIEANQQGMATFEFIDSVIALNGEYSIIGRALVVHVNPDDLESQPTGNAGPRVACGVIGIAETKTE